MSRPGSPQFAFPSAMRPLDPASAGVGSDYAPQAGCASEETQSSARRHGSRSGAEAGARGRKLEAGSEESAPDALAGAIAAALLPRLQLAACRPAGAGSSSSMVAGAVECQLAARLRSLEQLEQRAAKATCELEQLVQAAAVAAKEAASPKLPLESKMQGRPSSGVGRGQRLDRQVGQSLSSPLDLDSSPCGSQSSHESPCNKSPNRASLVDSTKSGNVSRPRRMNHARTAGLDKKQFLEKAFVVNFRRLIKLKRACDIIHELIKSTAIAALTLVAASNYWEFVYSLLFVIILLFLFSLNTSHMHTMDDGKYKMLADLLEDDDPDPETNGPEKWDNPNRFLKSLTLSRGSACLGLGRVGRRKRAFLGTTAFALLCIIAWVFLVWEWVTDNVFNDERYGGPESMRFYGALLMVGTLMLGFYIFFEAMYWRETQSVMPMGKNGKPWDVKSDGIPPKFRWLGLPSMWFSSQHAKDDLILWANYATTNELQLEKDRHVDKIYPEEIAVLSLDSRFVTHLRYALRKAKLFSYSKDYGGKFLIRRCNRTGFMEAPKPVEIGEIPEELGMHLVFYDSQCPAYNLAEEVKARSKVKLMRGRSLVSKGSGSPTRGAGDRQRSPVSPVSHAEGRPRASPKERCHVRFSSEASELDLPPLCGSA